MEMKVLESENLHHQNFYLREGYDRNKFIEMDKQIDDKLITKLEPKLDQLVKDAGEDMMKQWNLINYDRAGDFMQCIPKPGTFDEFYVIQPTGIKNQEKSK